VSVKLLEWSTITVGGADAATFLDGQLAQSVDQGTPGAWTAVLEPDSTVICAGWLRSDADGFELLVPGELAEVTLARLRRFRLRVDVALALHSGARDAPLTRHDELLERAMPWVGEYSKSLAPHAFGRSFVARSIDFTKGCFTGQELVGRMDARGATVPFRFARVSGQRGERVEEVVRLTGPAKSQGVTTVFEGRDEFVAHAIVHRSLLGDGAPEDVRVEEID